MGNEAFLASMTPHHSHAILVCQEPATTDPGTEQLCEAITETQREEIIQTEEYLGKN